MTLHYITLNYISLHYIKWIIRNKAYLCQIMLAAVQYRCNIHITHQINSAIYTTHTIIILVFTPHTNLLFTPHPYSAIHTTPHTTQQFCHSHHTTICYSHHTTIMLFTQHTTHQFCYSHNTPILLFTPHHTQHTKSAIHIFATNFKISTILGIKNLICVIIHPILYMFLSWKFLKMI